MEYDGYRSEGPSLAVKLMQIAGEYELDRKRERSKLESGIAEHKARLATSEIQLRESKETNSALSKRIATLEGELDQAVNNNTAQIQHNSRALLVCRFQLCEALDELATLQQAVIDMADGMNKALAEAQDALALCDQVSPDTADENQNTTLATAGARAVGALRAVTPALANLLPLTGKLHATRAAAQAASRWSRASLLSAVERGDDAEVLSILQGRLEAPQAQDAASQGSDAFTTALGQALLLAAAGGNLGMCRVLMSSGADVAVRSIEDGLLSTVLHVAAVGGHDTVLKAMLGRDGSGASTGAGAAPAAQAGLTIDVCDAYGRTPLHVAAAGGHAGTVKFLLLAGADPGITDVHGHTAADIAQGTEQYATSQDPKGRHYASGELPLHPASSACVSVLADPNLSFWNASVRANRYYNERTFEKAIGAYSRALELAPSCSMSTSARDLATLHYNRARARYRIGAHCDAVEDCSAALRNDATYRNAMAQRAECYMSLFDFERAARDFQGLLESDPADRQWGRRLSEARAMRDMSHYGMLGVRKDADPSTIKKAYRSLCLRWHPDKVEGQSGGSGGRSGPGSGPEAELRANTVFRRLTEAYETLSDSYKRMIYDMDPRSNIGTPVSSSTADGSARDLYGRDRAGKGTGGDTPRDREREGFERWAAREREREDERDRERSAAAAAAAATAAGEEQVKASARATRAKLAAAGRVPPPSPPRPQARAHTSTRHAVSSKDAAGPASASGQSSRPSLHHTASAGAALGSAAAFSKGEDGTGSREDTTHRRGDSTSSTNATINGESVPSMRRAASDGAIPGSRPPSSTRSGETRDGRELPRSPTTGPVGSAPARRVKMDEPRPAPPPSQPASSAHAAASMRTAFAAQGEDTDRQASLNSSRAYSLPGSLDNSHMDAGTDTLQAAAAATAARARAAVAQAEAFVRLVQAQAKVQAGLGQAAGSSGVPTADNSSASSSVHGDDEDMPQMDKEQDKAAARARVEARARAEASRDRDGRRSTDSSLHGDDNTSSRPGASPEPGSIPGPAFSDRPPSTTYDPSKYHRAAQQAAARLHAAAAAAAAGSRDTAMAGDSVHSHSRASTSGIGVDVDVAGAGHDGAAGHAHAHGHGHGHGGDGSSLEQGDLPADGDIDDDLEQEIGEDEAADTDGTASTADDFDPALYGLPTGMPPVAGSTGQAHRHTGGMFPDYSFDAAFGGDTLPQSSAAAGGMGSGSAMGMGDGFEDVLGPAAEAELLRRLEAAAAMAGAGAKDMAEMSDSELQALLERIRGADK